MLSFVVVVLLGPHFANGERWEVLVLNWFFFGMPIALLAAAASTVLVYPFYVGVSRVAAAFLYVTNVLLVAGFTLLPALYDGVF